MGKLIIKDSTLESLRKVNFYRHHAFSEIENMGFDEICSFNDSSTGRNWEFERVI
jgi:hypothetical protein